MIVYETYQLLRPLRRGAHSLFLSALGLFVLAGVLVSHANADDAADCAKVTGEEPTIAACTRRIESGELNKQGLTLAYYNRGQAWFRKAYGKNVVADFDRAIADYSETIRLDPNFAEAYAHRGFGWAVKGNFDQAFTDFDNAIRIDPKSVISYRHRGIWRRQRGDNDRAILDFDQAIRLDPNSGVAYFDRALAWQFKGNIDRAIADYTESIGRPPPPINAYGNRGALYFTKGDFDRAIADFSDGISLDPKRASFFKSRGEAYEKKGDFDRAISDYTDAISLQQNYTAALRNRALVYERIGQPDHAIIDLRAILQSDPKQADAKERIGRMEKKIAALTGTKPAVAAPQVAAPPITSLPALSGRRVALVIGNGAYQHVPALPNPPNDSADVAASLERLGFLVTKLPNARFDDMRRKLIEFGRQARGAEWQ